MLPALLIGYNRPTHTSKVVESLRAAGVQELYVALDGARPGDETACTETRSVVETVSWARKVECRFSEENQGPGWGPRIAIEWFFDQVPVGIICEDDTWFAPDAASFLTDAAADFRSTTQMAAATSLGAQEYRGGASYFASRYATTWGWATTAQAWAAYDYSMTDWPSLRDSSWLLDVGGSAHFRDYWTNVFDMTYADRDHYWDYQWQYAMWKEGWCCWHPRVNLVTNIGFDSSATHTRVEHAGLTRLSVGSMLLPLVAPESDQPDARVDRWIDHNVYRSRRSLRGKVYRAVFRRGD